jgi:hypothetical protein
VVNQYWSSLKDVWKKEYKVTNYPLSFSSDFALDELYLSLLQIEKRLLSKRINLDDALKSAQHMIERYQDDKFNKIIFRRFCER